MQTVSIYHAAVILAGVPAAAALMWMWVSWKSYDFIPLKYQYRPGSFSAWLANLLHNHAKARREQKPLRVYCDGCFDMMHYGHANALRQAKAVGDQLVVGLIPDDEIRRCKGPPVMPEEERRMLVEAVKWVDEVITDVPYDLSPEFINRLFTKHQIDVIVHGDDPCLLPDGTDAYAHAKKLGRFVMIKRTEGVSTTDIVGRMLMCTRVNSLVQSTLTEQERSRLTKEFSSTLGSSHPSSSADGEAGTKVSRFMPTTRRLTQFSEGRAAPADARIVYIDGAFDVFHCGHVAALKRAKEMGDFLLVGIHSDEEVNARRGEHLPIMSLHERSLSVLACKYADEVVIGAPAVVSRDLIRTFNIGLVVRGSHSETSHVVDRDLLLSRYAVPQDMGIFREMASPHDMTMTIIIHRINRNRQEFERRQERKMKSEAAYYRSKKQFVAEK